MAAGEDTTMEVKFLRRGLTVVVEDTEAEGAVMGQG